MNIMIKAATAGLAAPCVNTVSSVFTQGAKLPIDLAKLILLETSAKHRAGHPTGAETLNRDSEKERREKKTLRRRAVTSALAEGFRDGFDHLTSSEAFPLTGGKWRGKRIISGKTRTMLQRAVYSQLPGLLERRRKLELKAKREAAEAAVADTENAASDAEKKSSFLETNGAWEKMNGTKIRKLRVSAANAAEAISDVMAEHAAGLDGVDFRFWETRGEKNVAPEDANPIEKGDWTHIGSPGGAVGKGFTGVKKVSHTQTR
jgi:hypothetical protein